MDASRSRSREQRFQAGTAVPRSLIKDLEVRLVPVADQDTISVGGFILDTVSPRAYQLAEEASAVSSALLDAVRFDAPLDLAGKASSHLPAICHFNDEGLHVTALEAGQRRTLLEIERYLASAANLPRGSIDQADVKAYIFPLMFFKRISDTYREEFDRALAESGGDREYASFAENHHFAIPPGSLWDDVRERTENVDQALVTEFRSIEKANPETLYGIFGNAGWTNKEKLPDAKLLDLIEHGGALVLPNPRRTRPSKHALADRLHALQEKEALNA